jgi:hypothetical protein
MPLVWASSAGPGVSPFDYDWDTTPEREGPHTLVARATSGALSVDSPVRTVFVDRTPPGVVSASPASGDAEADTLQPIRVTFSEPIAPTSLGGVTLESGGKALPLAPTLSTDGLELSIPLLGLPPLPATIAVSLASVTDLAGNPLDPRQSGWSFTAPAWIQLGPALGGSITSVQMVAAPDGTVLVSYGTSNNGAYLLHVQRWDGQWHEVGQGFTDAGVLDNRSLAVDGSGAPIVLYRFSANGDQSYVHQVVRWDDASGTFQPLGPPLTSGGDFDSALAADGLGHIVAAYTAPDGEATGLFTVTWNGSAWQSLGLPLHHASNGVVDAPSVAIDSQGDAVFVYREDALELVSAYVTGYRQGELVPLDSGIPGGLNAFPGQGAVGIPALAAAHADHPFVAFTEPDPMSTADLFAYRWDTASWPALPGAPMLVGSACAVAVDSLDRPIALYHDSSIRPNAYVIRWDPGSLTWTPLGADPVDVGLQHVMVADSTGRAVVFGGATGKVLRANQ